MGHKGRQSSRPRSRITGMRHIDVPIDGRLHQAGDRYTLSEQTPRPAALASEMGHKRPCKAFRPHTAGRERQLERCRITVGIPLRACKPNRQTTDFFR
jgi:hypothetical protein